MKLQTIPALALVGLVASLAGCVTPAPTQLRIAVLEQKVSALETKLLGLGNADMLGQLDGIEKRERDIRGQLEKVAYDLEGAERRQRQLYRDLDSRLQNLEPVGANQTGSTGQSGGTQGGYQQAFEELKKGQVDSAIAGFEGFIAAYPNGELAGNAHYWLGEAYYVKREYAKAGTEFSTVVEQHNSSTKVKDALLKLGYVKYEQKEFRTAREILNRVINEFPGTTVASLAEQRLQLMSKNRQ